MSSKASKLATMAAGNVSVRVCLCVWRRACAGHASGCVGPGRVRYNIQGAVERGDGKCDTHTHTHAHTDTHTRARALIPKSANNSNKKMAQQAVTAARSVGMSPLAY